MKKITRFFNDCSIGHKFLIIFICTCFVPMIILGSFSYLQMVEIIKKEEKKNFENFLSQTIETIDFQENIYNNLSNYIAFNNSVSQMFTYNYQSAYEYYNVLVESFDPLLSSIKYFHDEIIRVTLYVEGNIVKHDSTLAKISEILNEPWYEEVCQDLDIHWFVNYGDKKVFSVRKMPILQKEGILGVLYIEVNYDTIFGTFEQMNNTDYGIIVLDGNDAPVYEYNCFNNSKYIVGCEEFIKAVKEQNYGEINAIASYMLDISEENYLVSSGIQEVAGFKVFSYKPSRLISGYIQPIRDIIILMVLLCIIASVVAVYFVSKFITGRLVKLNENINQIEQGSLEIMVVSSDKDEIGMLIRGFGDMVKRIQTLIDVVYEGKLKQKEYEMKALQAQINPHFLYNTLSLINWKAIAAGREDISEITLLLASFYRTALNKGKNIIKVSGELENVRAYLKIQLVMHDNEFEVVEDINEDISEYNTINLILQPIIENAINHGIELKEDGVGIITIKGYLSENSVKEKCIIFEVSDNGAGMDKETAEKILTEKSKGYGVRNVNERIKLYYGEEYHLEIDSKEGIGTKITIKIPALKE